MTKQEARKFYREVRAKISPEAADLWSREMAESLGRRLREKAFDSVLFLYSSLPGEPDLLRYLPHGPYNIALPKTYPNGAMDFFLWFPCDELTEGSLGILEPGDDAVKVYPRKGDCAVVPALAVDPDGFRLGGGQGYYDRWLDEFKPRLLFTAAAVFPPCISAQPLPREPHDIPVDFLISEKGGQ
jgi:5-formyltetrahydrofolate cyclo-ligase